MIRLSVSGANSVIKRIDRAQSRVRKELKEATKVGTDLVAQSAKQRVLPARAVNVQDSRGRYRRLSGRTPVRVRYDRDGLAGYVRVQSYQGKARSTALQAVYGRIGRFKELTRTGLWLDPDAWIKGPDGKFQGRKKSKYNDTTSRFLRFHKFSENPGLEDWANRREKGSQSLRHTIRIRPDAIGKLTTAPSLRRNEKAIRELYASAAIRGVT